MDIEKHNRSPHRTAFLYSIMLSCVVSTAFAFGPDSETPQRPPSPLATASFSTSPMRVEAVTSRTFDKLVMKSTAPVLVDFYADWCGPCRTQSKILNGFVSKLNKGAKIVKVDVDANAALAQRFGVTALPTLILVQHGKVVGKQVGIVSETQLREVFSSYLAKDDS